MARLKDFLKAQAKSLKPAFFSKQPHFNFISAHCKTNNPSCLNHLKATFAEDHAQISISLPRPS